MMSLMKAAAAGAVKGAAGAAATYMVQKMTDKESRKQ